MIMNTIATRTLIRTAPTMQKRSLSGLSQILTKSAGATPGAAGKWYSQNNLPVAVYPIVGILGCACSFGTYTMFYSSKKQGVHWGKESKRELNVESIKDETTGHLPLQRLTGIRNNVTKHMNVSGWAPENKSG